MLGDINKSIVVVSKFRSFYNKNGVRHIGKDVLAKLLETHGLAGEGCSAVGYLVEMRWLEHKEIDGEEHWYLTDKGCKDLGIDLRKGKVELDSTNNAGQGTLEQRAEKYTPPISEQRDVRGESDGNYFSRLVKRANSYISRILF